MGVFTKGEVVLVRFPFSDLSYSKLRPALILAVVGRNDYILCQITSKAYGDPNAIQIESDDFQSGSLKRISYARGSMLFTANSSLITRAVGTLEVAKIDEIISSIVNLLRL